jgi:hypothetical protein
MLVKADFLEPHSALILASRSLSLTKPLKGDGQCDEQGPLLQPLPAQTCSEAAVQGLQNSWTSSVGLKAFCDSQKKILIYLPHITDLHERQIFISINTPIYLTNIYRSPAIYQGYSKH